MKAQQVTRKLIQLYQRENLDFEETAATKWAENIVSRAIENSVNFGSVIDRVLKWNGLEIGVEYLPGQVRFPGRKFSKKLRSGYGHIRKHKIEGTDGKALDCYIAPDTLVGNGSNKVFKISQNNENGEFDEFKIMIGYESESNAQEAYLQAMPHAFFGGIEEIDLENLESDRQDFAEGETIMDAESLLLLRDLLEETYTDGIDAIPKAEILEDGSITGTFEERINPSTTKKVSFTITDEEISYKLLNPDKIADLSGIEDFAAAAKKGKKCVKGLACGGTCISKNKACRKPTTITQKEKANKIKEKNVKTEKKKADNTGTGGEIKSYDAFKQEFANAYHKINRHYNMGDLVPIHRIREEMGNRVSREQFNKWALEMQGNDGILLSKGRLVGETPQKLKDSITTDLRGTMTYASKTQETPKEKLTEKNAPKKAIKTYSGFEKEALQIYDKINKETKADNLVPIYELRRKLGNKVTRDQFNDWLLEMQSKDILQLKGGSLPDRDQSKIEDSISTELSGLRTYASRLK